MTALAFLFGLLVGSFLNVCIHRLPIHESVVSPRSRCPRCAAMIAWYDNVPLISFAMRRGRCRNCKAGISWRYPFVELATGCLYVLIACEFGFGLDALKAAVLTSMLVVLFFTDLEHLLLPDPVTLGGLAAGIAFSPFVPLRPGLADVGYLFAGSRPAPFAVSVTESVLAAVVFGGALYVLGEAFYRLRGVDGLGLGDVKLVAMLGAFQGTSETLLILLAGCLLAILGGAVAVLVRGASWRTPLPLGSYVSAAAIGSVFVGGTILNRYWEFVLG